jgi:hypothetical protein
MLLLCVRHMVARVEQAAAAVDASCRSDTSTWAAYDHNLLQAATYSHTGLA